MKRVPFDTRNIPKENIMKIEYIMSCYRDVKFKVALDALQSKNNAACREAVLGNKYLANTNTFLEMANNAGIDEERCSSEIVDISVFNKCIVECIDNAIDTIKKYHRNGMLYYIILNAFYLEGDSKKGDDCYNAAVRSLEKHGYETYSRANLYKIKNEALALLSSIFYSKDNAVAGMMEEFIKMNRGRM